MRKLLFTLLIAVCGIATTSAQSKQHNQSHDSLILRYTIYYDWNEISASGEQKQTLHEVGRWLTDAADTRVVLIGWADPLQNEQGSISVAKKRAEEVSQWLQVHYKVSSDRIGVGEGGIDRSVENNDKARRVDVLELLVKCEKPVQVPDLQPVETESEELPSSDEVFNSAQQPQEDMTTSEEITPTPEAVELPKISHLSNLTIRANLLYWAGGLMNAGVEYKASHSRMSYLLNGGYSFFGNTNWNKNLGGWFIAPELRYYLGEDESWFVGAQLLAAGYNYKMGHLGYQGTMLGGGITGGYKLTLSDSFDMDFSLGLGYGSLKYDNYYHTDTNYNVRTSRDVVDNKLMPIQLGVTLIWKL